MSRHLFLMVLLMHTCVPHPTPPHLKKQNIEETKHKLL